MFYLVYGLYEEVVEEVPLLVCDPLKKEVEQSVKQTLTVRPQPAALLPRSVSPLFSGGTSPPL